MRRAASPPADAAMATFPVAEAQIVALFMEAIAYGIYLVTLGLCARALFWGRAAARGRHHWPLIAVALAMFVFATLDVAFGLRHVLDAFIFYRGPGGPDAEFENISYWVNVMKTVDTQIMTLIGDGMLIYRCYIIFSHARKWLVVAVPALLWVGNAGISGAIIYITATLRKDALLSVAALSPLLNAFLVITLVTNLLTTGLIVWKISAVDREAARWKLSSVAGDGSTPPHGRTRLAQVVRIIIESGALYTALVLVTFGTELAGSNAVYGVSDVMIMTVGISFNLIIVRVDRRADATETAQATQNRASIPLHFRAERSQATLGIEVTVDRVVARDVEAGSMIKDSVSVVSMPKTQWEAM
ncbi:hypothetical protein PsYK624_170930 [Phanerochaete sordida]|uniref:Uncharacterized protein n=1 Tax=Phanerochaete sordida TaxID=48140 RepID=A0A9P3GT18_9APHY|nr:hypothetical protein PsYK624_170930 [Phanerochaete sordida]